MNKIELVKNVGEQLVLGKNLKKGVREKSEVEWYLMVTTVSRFTMRKCKMCVFLLFRK